MTHIAELQARSNEVIGERMGGKSKKKISYMFDSEVEMRRSMKCRMMKMNH